MSERLKFQGRLQELELEAKKTELMMKGIVTAMRDLLDPLEAVQDLKTDVIFEQANQLSHYHSALRATRELIAEAKRIMGR
jgi:hypothetical protein